MFLQKCPSPFDKQARATIEDDDDAAITHCQSNNNMKASFLFMSLQVHSRYPAHFVASKKKSNWIKRHVKDAFVRQANDEGHMSRSYYKKLQQMNDKQKLISHKTKLVLELGATPGGWTSYVSNYVGADGTLVATDLLPLDPRVIKQLSTCSCTFPVLQGDFKSADICKQLDTILEGKKADFVLSDVATNFITGDSSTDALRTMSLVESAFLELSIHELLDTNGTFVAKYFSCADEVELEEYARRYMSNDRRLSHLQIANSRPNDISLPQVSNPTRVLITMIHR